MSGLVRCPGAHGHACDARILPERKVCSACWRRANANRENPGDRRTDVRELEGAPKPTSADRRNR